MRSPEIIQVDALDPDTWLLRRAASVLNEGGIIVFPTETVYGMGCLLSRKGAARRIYKIKGRDWNKPLAVYLHDVPSLEREVTALSDAAQRLIHMFLPGPLTLILKNREGTPTGYRISPHKPLMALLRQLPEPMVGTSANLSGGKDPSSVGDIAPELMRSVGAVIDSGVRPSSTPSTVVDCTGEDPVILREGRLSRGDIEAALG